MYFPKIDKSFFSFQNYLVVADSSIFKAIKVYEKSSNPEFQYQFTSIDVTEMTDMKVLDASLQSNVSGKINSISAQPGTLDNKC